MLAEAAPPAAALVAGGERAGALRGFPGVPGYLRRAAGPGWALVGDAGYFKDPLTAHGITDALRDAEFLSRAVVDGGPDALRRLRAHPGPALAAAVRRRRVDRRLRWDLSEIRDLLLSESAAMKPEVAALRGLDSAALAGAA